MKKARLRKSKTHGGWWKHIRPIKDEKEIALRLLSGLLQTHNEYMKSEFRELLRQGKTIPHGYTIRYDDLHPDNYWLEWVDDEAWNQANQARTRTK